MKEQKDYSVSNSIYLVGSFMLFIAVDFLYPTYSGEFSFFWVFPMILASIPIVRAANRFLHKNETNDSPKFKLWGDLYAEQNKQDKE